VVRFRPTYVQAIGRGAFLGMLIGVGCGAAVLVGFAAGAGSEVSVWVAMLVPPFVGPVAGSLVGVTLGRDEGADIDDVGIRPVPASLGAFTPWASIHDVRVERRGGRAQVAVYLDSGSVRRLRAPYDGRLLAADREFERKLFMLRNLWETHRTFTVNNHQTASEEKGPG
jgi:hypothetical protein